MPKVTEDGADLISEPRLFPLESRCTRCLKRGLVTAIFMSTGDFWKKVTPKGLVDVIGASHLVPRDHET